VQVRHRTLALGVFHEHLTRERHHRVRVPSSATTGTASSHAAATAKVHFITGCATVSDDAHADQDHRVKERREQASATDTD